METIIAEFVKANPNGAFILLMILIVLPVPAQIFITLKFLGFIKETSKVNQVLFNRFETLQNKSNEADKENSTALGVFSEIIRKCPGPARV